MRRLKSPVIPPLAEGEKEETRSVDEWASWSAQQVVNGVLKPQTKGGRPVRVGNAEKGKSTAVV